MAENYQIPLGIDPKPFVTGIDSMVAGLDKLTEHSKTATTSINETMAKTAASGEVLTQKLNAGAASAKAFQEAAKVAGVELEKAFSPEAIDTKKLSGKVSEFAAQLKNALGKPVDFKFNLDQSAVKEIVAKLGQAKSEMSAFNILLTSAKERLSGLKEGTKAFTDLNKQIQDAEKFLTEINGQPLNGLTDGAEKAASASSSLRSELKQMREELARMELAGQGSTEQFQQLSLRAGELQDQLGDTSQRIQRLASDTKALDAGIAAVRGLAGAFAVGQGALAAFGQTSEEAALAIQKVQGAMAILQGIQEIANVLNKDSALSIYLSTLATRSRTTAVVADTTAIGGQTVATEAATVATNTWTAALLANPITAIVAALVIAAAIVYKFADAEDEAAVSAERLNQQLETEGKLLTEDIAIIERAAKIRTAEAEAQKKRQSEIGKIELAILREKIHANQRSIEEEKSFIEKSTGTKKEDIEARKAANESIKKLEAENRNINAEGKALRIKNDQLAIEEENKLQQDRLKQKIANAEAEKEIIKASQQYANEILNENINQLQEGQAKEIAALNATTDAKVADLKTNQAIQLQKLEDQKKEIALALQVASDDEKNILELRQSSLNRQIALQKEQGKTLITLSSEIEESRAKAEQEIRDKYATKQREFEFDIQTKLLSLQKDGADKKIELLKLAADQQLQIVNSSVDAESNKLKQRIAIELKLASDIKDIQIQSALDEVELQRLKNENKISELRLYGDKRVKTEDAARLLNIQNEINAAEEELRIILESGDKKTDAEKEIAKKRVLAAQSAMKDELAKNKAQSIFEVLFPATEFSSAQQQFLEKTITDTLKNVGQAVSDYADAAVEKYQKLYDEKKKLAEQDEQDLVTLEEQLQKEMQLRDEGYANNVNGILAELAAKKEARDKDAKDAEEAQKRLAKAQKAQADAQAVLQAANLITASTNIYLQATALLGPAGVAVASIAVGAMVAAFVASQVKAREAANTQTFEKGGTVKGRRHSEGGQRYVSEDGSGGVVELEEGEEVTNRKSSAKYRKVLKAINNDTFGMMSDVQLRELLENTGVRMDMGNEVESAVREAEDYQTNFINNTISVQKTPEEMKSMDNSLKLLVKHAENKQYQYEEGDYIVHVNGSKKIKVRKTK